MKNNNKLFMCVKDQSSYSLLSLMQLISANFPLGNFSYSRGLEWAIEAGWVNSIEEFYNWQKQWIDNQLIFLDWPMLKRFYYYADINDKYNFSQCVLKILAFRETRELRLEEIQRGKSMGKLIVKFQSVLNKDNDWLPILSQSGLAAIAWLGNFWNIPLKNLALGYAYNILESSIIVGLKLIPFGQNQAQELLCYLIKFLPPAWDKANLLLDHQLGSSFLLQSIASSCHETQYSRMFLS